MMWNSVSDVAVNTVWLEKCCWCFHRKLFSCVSRICNTD